MKPLPVSIISWNCLADCYAPGVAENDVANPLPHILWAHRSARIAEILHRNHADVVCLQEVDNFDSFYKPTLRGLGYRTVYAQRRGRQDGALIAFKLTKFDLVGKDIVQFDDLAKLTREQVGGLSSQNLRKKNLALSVLLQTRRKASDDADNVANLTFSVCTTHLHWNPNLPTVKLAQAKYLQQRLTELRLPSGLPPQAAILTGDFNAMPDTPPYRATLRGLAYPPLPRGSHKRCLEAAVESLLVKTGDGDERKRFLCDTTLIKLVRWLRLLGIDAELEDKFTHDKRTAENDYGPLFRRAQSEKRVLVTTSLTMTRRTACPEAFLVKQYKTRDELKRSLAVLLMTYDVNPNRDEILSMCCKCGGHIETSHAQDARLKKSNYKFIPNDKQLFVCAKCHQVYWQNESARGSSTRARELADSLHSFIDKTRNLGQPQGGVDDDCDDHDGGARKPKYWLRYKSAFVEANGAEPEYTNINGAFRGTLDYVFVAGACSVRNTVRQERSVDSFDHGGHFPNEDWPSDHMLLRCELALHPGLAAPSLRRNSIG